MLAACLGIASLPAPTFAQVLLPYTPKQDPQSLEDTSKTLLRQAAGLVQFQQYEQAIPRVALATQLAPKNYEAWFFLGTLYVQTQKYQKGIDALQQAQAIKPQEPDVLFMLGSAYFSKRRSPQSDRSFASWLKNQTGQ